MKKYVEKRVGSHFSEIRPQESVMNSYPDVSKFPQDANPSQIVVDVSNESILVPIYGQTVPFHVDTIKSINKSEQAEFTILRINFLTPEGQANISKIPSYADLNSIYIRELSFKSSDSRNLNRVLRLVKELQKRMKQREQEYKEQATIVEQEELRLNKDKKEVPRLRDVQIRPKVGGKKNNGTFEAHLNGFRFVTHSNIIVGTFALLLFP